MSQLGAASSTRPWRATAAGGSVAGDGVAGDSAAGDSAAGDSAAGDSAAGDSAAGDVTPSDAMGTDAAPQDVVASDVTTTDGAQLDSAAADIATPADTTTTTDAAKTDVAPVDAGCTGAEPGAPNCTDKRGSADRSLCCAARQKWCDAKYGANQQAVSTCQFGVNVSGTCTGCIPWGPPAPPRFDAAWRPRVIANGPVFEVV